MTRCCIVCRSPLAWTETADGAELASCPKCQTSHVNVWLVIDPVTKRVVYAAHRYSGGMPCLSQEEAEAAARNCRAEAVSRRIALHNEEISRHRADSEYADWIGLYRSLESVAKEMSRR